MSERTGRRSAGILLHRTGGGGDVEVLLVHMGGPFWARREEGAWSIPKGEYGSGEEPMAAARREFEEELGCPPPDSEMAPLGEVRQPAAHHGIGLTDALRDAILGGFGPGGDGEDPFDAVVGLLGMLNVVLGGRASDEPADAAVRGWRAGYSARTPPQPAPPSSPRPLGRGPRSALAPGSAGLSRSAGCSG